MAFGDFLHRVASAIGLETDKNSDIYDEYDDDDEYDDVPPRVNKNASRYASPTRGASQRPQRQPVRDDTVSYRKPAPIREPRDPYDNVVQMPDRNKPQQYSAPAPAAQPNHGTMIVYISRKDDAEQLINYVLGGKSVILSCERIDDPTTQRVIDILSGAAYAVAGHVEKISKGNYLFAPSSVEIYSDMKTQAPTPKYGAAGR